MTILLVNC